MNQKRILACLMATMLLFSGCNSPKAVYKKAQKLLSRAQYTEAAAQFERVGDYEDAAALAVYCQAYAWCEAQNYDDGIAAFEELGSFMDSAALAGHYTEQAGPEYLYKRAQDDLSKGLFAQAAEKFERVSSYEDAAQLALYCHACVLCENGEYEAGLPTFAELGDLMDSAQRSTYYTGRAREAQAGEGDWEIMQEARDIYNAEPLFLDSAERIAALDEKIAETMLAQYNAAVEDGENGNYDAAFTAFERLGDYQDCVSRIAYYTIRQAEAALASSTDQNAVLEVALQYADMGSYLDAEARAESMTAQSVAIQENKYQSALVLMDSDQYQDAIALFENLDAYKDSRDQIALCEKGILYLSAVGFMNDGKYIEAIAVLDEIRTFKDSEALIAACEDALYGDTYRAATACMQEGKYDDAIAAFSQIKTYRDSEALIAACETAILDAQYDAAVALMNEGNYPEAISAFAAIQTHRDSEQQIENCNDLLYGDRYNTALSLMNDGLYEDALAIFQEISTYKDSLEQISNCEFLLYDEKYNNALWMIENRNYRGALFILNSMTSYKDSSQYIDICNQKIVMDDISVNAGMIMRNIHTEEDNSHMSSGTFFVARDPNYAFVPRFDLTNHSIMPMTVTVSIDFDGERIDFGENTIPPSKDTEIGASYTYLPVEKGEHSLIVYINDIDIYYWIFTVE